MPDVFCRIYLEDTCEWHTLWHIELTIYHIDPEPEAIKIWNTEISKHVQEKKTIDIGIFIPSLQLNEALFVSTTSKTKTAILFHKRQQFFSTLSRDRVWSFTPRLPCLEPSIVLFHTYMGAQNTLQCYVMKCTVHKKCSYVSLVSCDVNTQSPWCIVIIANGSPNKQNKVTLQLKMNRNNIYIYISWIFEAAF